MEGGGGAWDPENDPVIDTQSAEYKELKARLKQNFKKKGIRGRIRKFLKKDQEAREARARVLAEAQDAGQPVNLNVPQGTEPPTEDINSDDD